MIRIVEARNKAEVDALLKPSVIRDRATEKKAQVIVDHVRNGGDEALKAYAKALDGWGGPLEVPRKQIEAGARKAPAKVRAALKAAAAAIRDVATAQSSNAWCRSTAWAATYRAAATHCPPPC